MFFGLFRKKATIKWQAEKIVRDRTAISKRRARRSASYDAKQNIPEDSPKNNPKYSPFESSVFSSAQSRFAQLCRIYDNSLQRLGKAIDIKYRIDPLTKDDESNSTSNIQAEIDSAFTEESNKLHRFAKDEIKFNRDLRAFKTDNDLERSAKSTLDGVWITFIILACLLAESMFNMFIFKDVSAGLIGGFILAAGCSAANIVLGFFHGFGWRLIIHIWWLKRAAGILITLLTLIMAIALNFAIAHYRHIISDPNINLDEANLGYLLIKNLTEAPITGIGDLIGYILLLAGIAVFIFVAFETYGKFWDPYLGYSRMQSKADKASEKWQTGKTDTLERIKNIVTKCKDDWDNKIQRAKQNVSYAQEGLNVLVEHRGDILGAIEAMRDDRNHSLEMYREKNTYIRSAKPAHFDNWVEFDEMKKQAQGNSFLPTKTAEEQLARLKNNLINNQKSVANMKKQINEVQTSYLKGIEKKFHAIYQEEQQNVLKVRGDKKQDPVQNKTAKTAKEQATDKDSGAV